MRRSRSMLKHKDLRLRAEYALVRSAVALLRLLPIDVAAGIVGSVVAWIAPWTALHGRALANLAAAFPEWSEAERNRVAAAMWRNTGRTIAETLLLDRIVADPSRLEIEGRDAVERRLREPGANIGITLHMGNWEIARHCLRHLRRQARRRLSLAAKSLSRPVSARDAKPVLSGGPSRQSDDARRHADSGRGNRRHQSSARRRTSGRCVRPGRRRLRFHRAFLQPAGEVHPRARSVCPHRRRADSGSGAAFVAITVHGSWSRSKNCWSSGLPIGRRTCAI